MQLRRYVKEWTFSMCFKYKFDGSVVKSSWINSKNLFCVSSNVTVYKRIKFCYIQINIFAWNFCHLNWYEVTNVLQVENTPGGGRNYFLFTTITDILVYMPY